MANELGTWGVVIPPYIPPEMGPRNDIGQCGCVTYGVGAPVDADGQNNDVYVDTETQTAYQRQDGTWVIVLSGGSGGVAVYSGHYDGELPTLPIPSASVTAALNYDLDAPYKTWKWSGTDWNG